MTSKILFINNSKCFITDYGGYSTQMHYLLQLFQHHYQKIFYFTACFQLNNHLPADHCYTWEELRDYSRTICPLDFLSHDYLSSVLYFSHQSNDPTLSIHIINHIIEKYEINVLFFLGDVFLFRNDTDVPFSPTLQKSICWYPCHYSPLSEMDRRGLQRFDTIVALCPSVKTMLEEQFSTRKQIHYIPHIYEPCVTMGKEKVAFFREKWGVSKEAFVVFCNASLYETTNRKAIDCQLIAFANVYRQYPERKMLFLLHSAAQFSNIVICEQQFPIHPLMKALSLPSEAFRWNTRVLSKSDVAELYVLSDVVLCCSKSEGFGIPILEAQTYRTPVITTRFLSMKDHNWIPELICDPSSSTLNVQQEGYWAFPSSTAIAETIKKILCHPLDSSTLDEMQQKAIRCCDKQSIYRQWMEVL